MTAEATLPQRPQGRPIFFCLLWLVAPALAPAAEDWGAYAIVPSSTPSFVLEAVGAGTAEGTTVSIAKPSGLAHQKWLVVPKGEDFYAIAPASAPRLVLAASGGGTKSGTPIVLEADRGQPWQRWRLDRNEDGSYCLVPRHSPAHRLDHFGGEARPGARVDLWENIPGDGHLRWRIRPLAGSPIGSGGGAGPTAPSAYQPPEVAPGSVRAGEVKTFRLATSSIYPGTVREVAVFVPAQYDGSKPACVYVRTDGYNPAEKPLLEALIASGEMPVTIGVFVRPGELPSPVPGTIGRRNRCFEYDGMGDANARFLLDEILPEVARRFDLKLSPSGNDRCIAGISSGGIAAFNAAWERPDAFSRVYASSGSFVAFRGGHEFPTLVRKFEPKPIRAYLTTGTTDMENCAGDWFLLDQEMDKALGFSGYDYRFRIIDGGHGAGFFDHYREALAFVWDGWPAPVRVGPGAPRVRDILLPDEPWHPVADGYRDIRSAAVDAQGRVFFADRGADKVDRIDPDGTIRPFLADSGGAEGLAVGPKGELFATSTRTGRVMGYDASGVGTLVVDGLRGRQVLATPNGGLYVAAQGDGPEGAGEVWFVEGGRKTRVDSGLKLATGLAYRPDRWLLAVADGGSKWAYSYQIEPDGRLANKERFFPLHVADGDDDAGAGSACYAREGPMLVATRAGVQACADDGPVQAILPVPGGARVVAACLGGADLDTLFAFTADRIWRRKVRVHGIGAFTPRAAVGASRL